ncbi:hypothetical protein J6590_096317 [Homalodisca vitripennis]|nr:hypothetical protein J6590_096317 [Homalodisca vitripennis]
MVNIDVEEVGVEFHIRLKPSRCHLRHLSSVQRRINWFSHQQLTGEAERLATATQEATPRGFVAEAA